MITNRHNKLQHVELFLINIIHIGNTKTFVQFFLNILDIIHFKYSMRLN
jgi:hypothetical protein